MTKSPLALAREALLVAQKALPAYSNQYSRHDFTQAQLFTILVLKAFFKTDYRGIVQMLADHSDLRRLLELKKLPHYSTLDYARQRRVKKRISSAFRAPSLPGPDTSA